VFYNYERTRSRKSLALVEHWRSEYATFAWALENPANSSLLLEQPLKGLQEVLAILIA